MGSKEKRKRMKAEKAAGERAAQKKAAGRTGGRRTGYILLAAGALLIIAGLYLFSRTWGVNLLFTAVWLGRISRFYWAVILIGAGLGVLGAAALKKSPAAGAKGAAPEPVPEEAPFMGAAGPVPKEAPFMAAAEPVIPEPAESAVDETAAPVFGGAAKSEPADIEAGPEAPEAAAPESVTPESAAPEAAKEELAAARQEEEAAKTVQKETEKEAEKGEGRVCPVCGNRLSARSRFCGKCGTKIE